MNVSNTYRTQQQYYGGFTFCPIRGLKKNNLFLYKSYAGKQKLSPVFNSVLNGEVLDNNYIQTIRKKIVKGSIPQTRTVVTELLSTREAMEELLLIPSDERLPVVFAVRALRSLESTLLAYQEAQHKLTGELKKLLSGKDFTTIYKTTSEDINHVQEVLQQMSDCLECSITCLSEFKRLQPVTPENRVAALMAKYQVGNLVGELQKLVQVQKLIILQMNSWKGIRELHEQQEVLN